MSYEYITQYNATSYSIGRQGKPIKYIVIHHWGQPPQTFENVINWFCSPNCPTSAHYVAEEGRVACLVDLENTAYHAGTWDANCESIGIECRIEASDGDYQTVAELIAEIWKTYGKLPLVRHKDIVPTACPGIWDIDRLHAMAEAIYNGESQATYTNPNQPSDWAEEGWMWAQAVGLCDGTRPHDALTREEAVIFMQRMMQMLKPTA